jgi:hypothetical protein
MIQRERKVRIVFCQKMKMTFIILSLSAALALILVSRAALAATEGERREQEPRISVPPEELQKDTYDDEGLKRVGNFGKFHLFGYGQAEYSTFVGPTPNKVDLHFFTIGVGYDFTDRIKMRAEIDFEHGFKEPEIEFATVDFFLKRWANARAGVILVPMGVINEHHEPPLIYSVERPETYRLIIPTEWQGIGAGFHGELPAGLSYELYGLSSLIAVRLNDDGTIDQSFTGSDGFDDTHSVAEAPGRDFGAAGRLEYRGIQGLRLAGSFFVGNTGQGNGAIGGGLLTMLEGDAKYSFQGVDLDGIFAFANLGDAGNINNVLIAADPSFTDFVGSQLIGWYLEGAYHVFHHLLPSTSHDLVVFGRFENTNTQHKMPVGFAADPANDRHNVTVGLSYLPIPQVAIKADYQFNWNAANADVDRLNLGIGFYY